MASNNQDELSSAVVAGSYISPYDRYTDLLTDFEAGGIALNDGNEGLDVQIWSLRYDGDEDSPNYGDLIVSAEDTGESAVIINVPDVVSCALAFDQNMNPFIAYELADGSAKFYWYDIVLSGYTTTTLPAGSRSLQCCLDDHRQTQTGASDIIIAYIRNGTLYTRKQRDRFTVEYTRKTGIGMSDLHKIGMMDNWRLWYDIRRGRGVRLSEIVGDILTMGENGLQGGRGAFSATDFDVSALYPIEVRGFYCAQGYSKAEAIKALQRIYFFDMPEIDGRLVAVLRGGDVVKTIYNEETVLGEGIELETAREQGVEFAARMSVAYQCLEYDYIQSKETSERRSPDVRVMSELSVQNPVNMAPDEVAQVARKLHKVSWNEQEGRAKFSLPESYIDLIPSDPCLVEVAPGETKRMRLQRYTLNEGQMEAEFVIDRVSSYSAAGIVAAPGLGASPAPRRLPGDTTWQFMDLPVLDGATDTLHYYVAAFGESSAWAGAQLQRQVGTDWLVEANISGSDVIGQLEAALPAAPAAYIDTTNTILVSLSDDPEATDTAGILRGAGAWLVGNEIIQVRDWVAEGTNWRGSYLTRGRKNTAAVAHSIAERVVYLDNPEVVATQTELLDTTLTLRAPSVGQYGYDAAESDHVLTGKSQEEWAPIDLVANLNGSDWELAWTPRYRLGSSANPQPSSHFYGWRIRFTVGATTATKTIESVTPQYTYTASDQANDFGSAQSSFDTVEIRALNRLGGEGEALSEAVS